MTLSSETHTTIRILGACALLVSVFYFVAQVETKPKEHIVHLRIQTSPSK